MNSSSSNHQTHWQTKAHVKLISGNLLRQKALPEKYLLNILDM